MIRFRNSLKSYSDPTFNKFIVEKVQSFSENFQTHRILDSNNLKIIAAIGLLSESPRILDIGGSAGTHFFLAKTIYPQKNFEWRIIENETLVKETTKDEIDSQLNYYSEFMSATENYAPDLIILSSTLQYLVEPLEKLKALIALGSNYILVTKTPMSNETPKTVIQNSRWNANGPGDYPQVSNRYKLRSTCNIVASEDFIKLISTHYEIILSFHEGSFKFSRLKRSIPYRSYLLRLKH